MTTKKNFYSNPAFCQQSEFPNVSSPRGSVRHSPVGALTVPKVSDIEDGLGEQEFYEEVVVDAEGFITDKKFVVVAQNNEGKKYIQVPQSEDRLGSRYGIPSTEETRQGSRYAPPQQFRQKGGKITRTQSMRYEYIQMQEQDSRMTTPRKNQYHDDTEITSGRVHRYAVIEPEEETELTSTNTRYALVPVDQLNNLVSAQPVTSRQNTSRYEYIQDHQTPPTLPAPSRYDYIPDQGKPSVPHQSPSRYDSAQGQSKPHSPSRYDYIPDRLRAPVHQSPSRYEQIQKPQQGSPSRYDYPAARYDYPPKGNPVATQKLHELLTTPRKPIPPRNQLTSPRSARRVASPPLSPILSEFQVKTPQKSRGLTPKAQQKLNYALGTRQLAQQDKRSTAIVAPMCSSPIQSVYSETTYSKSGSWLNLSVKKAPAQTGLSLVAMMMLMSGSVTSGLCFYMISNMGRQYFLDFGIVAGFTCLVLGLLGFRSRKVSWLPNRNYVSGYLVLTLLSLLTSAGLLVLLLKHPRAGTPIADITSGAVCGVSVLCLLMAATGVVSSYCCRYPPPDNRVQHCAEGFAV